MLFRCDADGGAGNSNHFFLPPARQAAAGAHEDLRHPPAAPWEAHRLERVARGAAPTSLAHPHSTEEDPQRSRQLHVPLYTHKVAADQRSYIYPAFQMRKILTPQWLDEANLWRACALKIETLSSLRL